MSEKEATEEQINEKMEEIIELHSDKAIRLLAKLISNCRYDLNEMKLELLKVFKPEDNELPKEECNGSFYT